MRLNLVKSKNAIQLYIIKSTYHNKKNSSVIVKKLGNYDTLLKELNGQDPIEWGHQIAREMTELEKEKKLKIQVSFSPNNRIELDKQHEYNGGYLFLQKIYNELGIPKICSTISKRHSFSYDLNNILSRLVYSRILYPKSKLKTFFESKKFIQQPNFQLHDIYRALDVLEEENEFIQAEMYKNNCKNTDRNTSILYYDCTNYFFESGETNGLRQFGISKEHRPNPIVQMGLFLDANGIPLSFCINAGNTNEQGTLLPMEKRIITDFSKSKFVICTDAGLSSLENRKFNNIGDRAFVTTQSLKQIKNHLKEWALDPSGWHLLDSKKIYNINDIDEEFFYDSTFYKERWINENGLEQRLIVSYSIKYRNYQRYIRQNQIIRAEKIIKNPSKLKKNNQNDYKRLVSELNVTPDGEIAENKIHLLNEILINKEEEFDGFYAVCTNLEDEIKTITNINKRRWEIEESFRIMKTEFKARPIYLQNDNRIKAHFLTCFMALTIFRLLEKKLNSTFPASQIIQSLKNFNFLLADKAGFIPSFTRTDLTDQLIDCFQLPLDTEIIPHNVLNKFLK